MYGRVFDFCNDHTKYLRRFDRTGDIGLQIFASTQRCMKHNVHTCLEFYLACVFIHLKLYGSEQRDPDKIAQMHMLFLCLRSSYLS